MYTPFWKKGQRSFSYPTRQCIVLTLNSSSPAKNLLYGIANFPSNGVRYEYRIP